MKLNEEEKAMLAGEAGVVAKTAIEHQMKVGRFFGATDFVPVAQAHIMADTESLGQAGVVWLEKLADANEGGVRIPTITAPRGTDFNHANMHQRQYIEFNGHSIYIAVIRQPHELPCPLFESAS